MTMTPRGTCAGSECVVVAGIMGALRMREKMCAGEMVA